MVNANIEEIVERDVQPLAEENPWQKVFMYNSVLSDTVCFEPEHGMSQLLAEYYATTPGLRTIEHVRVQAECG